MAHNVQIGPNGETVCTNCGLRENFQEGCKFSIQSIENKKIIVGAVLSSLGYLIFFLFVAVVYLGIDGLKMQISRVVDECRKGGLFAAISHLFRRR
jgi:hypothetical protein